MGSNLGFKCTKGRLGYAGQNWNIKIAASNTESTQSQQSYGKIGDCLFIAFFGTSARIMMLKFSLTLNDEIKG